MSGRERLLRALPWLFGLVAFGIAAKKLIGGYGDLGIYLDVARELSEGGHDLCRPRPDSGPWVYPPWVALPFVLLDALLGDGGARWAWCALMGVATAMLLQALAQLARATTPLRWWQWLAFGLLFQRCIAQNLSHGQLSLWVGALVAMGTADLSRERDRRAGLWLGLAAALKVTPLVFLPALLLLRRGRAAAMMTATITVALGALTLPFCGLDEHLRHLADFWRTATGALTAPDSAAITTSRAGPSLNGTLDYLLQARPIDRDGYTVNVVDLGDGALRAVKIAWAAALLTLLTLWWRAADKLDRTAKLAERCAVTVMLMTWFSPLVRVYHLAAMLPAALLFCEGPRSRRDTLWLATATALLFTMTLRQRNLLGETLWRWLDLGGLLHFALVAMCAWRWRQVRAEGSGNPPA